MYIWWCDVWSDSWCEPNSLVFVVEVGVEGLDEAVSQNEGLSELGGKVQTNYSDNASRFSSLVHLQDVVFSLKSVAITTDFENKVGQFGDSWAIDLFLFSSSEGFGHVLYNFSRSNQHRCSSVDNTQNVSNFVTSSIEDNIINRDAPVVSSLERVVFEGSSVIFGVDSSQNQSWSVGSWDSGQVEGEGVAFDLALLDEQVEDQGKSVDWDGRPGHSQNAVELGGDEADSVEGGDLGEEGVFGGQPSEPGGVLADESWNCTWTIGNVEMGSVVHIGGALGRVVVFVEIASCWQSALFGGNPEVGGSSIEDDSKWLRGSTDINLSK